MGDTELEVKSCWGRCPRDRAEVPNDFRNGKFVIVLLKPGLEDPQLCVSEPRHPRQPKPEEENEAGRGMQRFGKAPPLSGLCGMRRMQGGQGWETFNTKSGAEHGARRASLPPQDVCQLVPRGVFWRQGSAEVPAVLQGLRELRGQGPRPVHGVQEEPLPPPRDGCLPAPLPARLLRRGT